MLVSCESLNHSFEIPDRLERVVSLTSGATEAIFAMDRGDCVAGVSEYCSRYVPNLSAPVVGDYLCVDDGQLARVQPDLVLVTTGVQRKLGMRLAEQGLPVYALPVPGSFHGILENSLTLAALLNALPSGQALVQRLATKVAELRASAPESPPRIYVELWFGRHMRTIGGRSFIHDTVRLAGTEPLFRDRREAYFVPDFEEVSRLRPDLLLFFSEPEYPIDTLAILEERGWADTLNVPIIESTIECGRNVIHDGPSCIETSFWLKDRISARTCRKSTP